MLVGLSPFLICEAALRFSGWQAQDAVRDPYVGFTEIQPLFELDDAGTRYEISKRRMPLFQPDSFLADKPLDEFRIFCVGGSTVQGRPFSIETAFSTWLELDLKTTNPSRQWQVVNCGGVSYASYRLAPIVEEILDYQPDLIILYTGHNEFLEDRTYQSVRDTPDWVARSHEHLSSFKTYSFLRRYFIKQDSVAPQDAPNVLPTNVQARLDFQNGLELYHRDPSWYRDIVGHFELNFRRMVSTIRTANVPLIVCNPACDLRDSAPFKSENRADISTTDLRTFSEKKATFEANSHDRSVAEEKRLLEDLLILDPQYAMTHFQYASICLASGEEQTARKHFLLAKELDICPLRATEPIYRSIAKITDAYQVPTVDVRQSFTQRAADQIPGRESLIDHVHPTIHGHQLIAAMLHEKIQSEGWIATPSSEPRSETNAQLTAALERTHTAHLESLPFMYFQRGKDRLAGLKRWAAGKVTKPRPADNKETATPKIDKETKE